MTLRKRSRPSVLEPESPEATEPAAAGRDEIPAETADPRREITSGGLILARITWLFVGPVALCLLLVGIVNAGSGWATVLDAVFFVLLGLIVLCRWTEQRSGKALTAYGDEPSTWAHFRRFVTAFVPLALGAWVVANVIGNHILG